jgi:hypothetical protein
MPRKPSLHEILGHPVTQSAIQQLSQGIDPRLIAARLAGDALTDHLAARLGAPAKPRHEVIDAEYTVIDVTPKKRGK